MQPTTIAHNDVPEWFQHGTQAQQQQFHRQRSVNQNTGKHSESYVHGNARPDPQGYQRGYRGGHRGGNGRPYQQPNNAGGQIRQSRNNSVPHSRSYHQEPQRTQHPSSKIDGRPLHHVPSPQHATELSQPQSGIVGTKNDYPSTMNIATPAPSGSMPARETSAVAPQTSATYPVEEKKLSKSAKAKLRKKKREGKM